MALVTLLEYLVNNKLRSNLVIGKEISLNDVCVEQYEISPESCRIYTDRGDDISFDVSKFNNFTFDAAWYKPSNSIEMLQCLRTLEEDLPYNAYLETADEEFIAGFYKIGRISYAKERTE